MNIKKITMAMMLAAVMVVLAACGGSNEEADNNEADESSVEYMEIEHELDSTPVKVKKNPENIVVFDFGVLDTLDDLGIEVSGVPKANVPTYLSKYEDEKYTNVGALKEPELETIHTLNPDVIFISHRQADMYDELSDIAPTVYVGLDYEDYIGSFKSNMTMIAELFDQEEKVQAELDEIDNRIEQIQDKTKNSDNQALIVLATEGKVSAYGSSSRFGLIHDELGYKAADEDIEVSTHGQNITFEYILEMNPDVLFVIDRDAVVSGEASAKDTIENDLVKKTTAYENDAIYYLDPNYWYLSGGGLLSVKEMLEEIEESLE